MECWCIGAQLANHSQCSIIYCHIIVAYTELWMACSGVFRFWLNSFAAHFLIIMKSTFCNMNLILFTSKHLFQTDVVKDRKMISS